MNHCPFCWLRASCVSVRCKAALLRWCETRCGSHGAAHCCRPNLLKHSSWKEWQWNRTLWGNESGYREWATINYHHDSGCSPHLCVGFLFLVLYPAVRLLLLLPSSLVHTLSTHNLSSHKLLTHNLSSYNLLTHNLSSYNLLTHTTCHHTTCSHTTCSHITQLAHTELALTQLVITQLAHTQLTHTQLALTQFAHTELDHIHTTCSHTTCHHTTCSHTTCSHRTCSHTTCHHTTCSHTTYSHTTCSHTICSHTTCHHTTCSHTTCPPFALQAWHIWHWAGCGGALGSRLAPWAPRLFAWQAWHLATWTFTLRGRRGTWRHQPSLCVAGLALMALGWLWWRAWFPFGAVGAAAVCVAGVALGDMDLHFAWQAWHLVTWILTLRGKRGTYGTGLALVARLVLRCRRGRRGCLRGRRGTWRHGPSFATGVALGDINRHFVWQAWHLWHWAASGGALGSRLAPWAPRLFAWQAWHLATWTFTLRGRRGTWWHGSSLCVAGVALMALGWLWWRAWFSGVAGRGRRGFLRGRRGTWRHVAALCVAGVALWDITFVSRGRRGTWTHRLPLCVAAKLKCQKCHMSCTHMSRTRTAMIPDHINKASTLHMTLRVTLRCRRGTYGTGLGVVARLVPVWRRGRRGWFAWQAWHLATWTFTLRDRRGTWRHQPSLCVAGLALMALGWLWWRAWFPFGAVGAAAVCVAGVVLGRSHTTCPHTTCSHTTYSHAGVALRDIHRHFVWQAWHVWHWAGSGGALGSQASPWAPRLFAWQALYLDAHIQLVHTQLAHTQLTHTEAWHFETSTVTLCGRPGTYGTGLALVARRFRNIRPLVEK